MSVTGEQWAFGLPLGRPPSGPKRQPPADGPRAFTDSFAPDQKAAPSSAPRARGGMKPDGTAQRVFQLRPSSIKKEGAWAQKWAKQILEGQIPGGRLEMKKLDQQLSVLFEEAS